MPKQPRGTNPFYVLLVAVGLAFVVTACAYGVLAFRQANPASQPLAASDRSLMGVLDRHGAAILGGEVLLLGLFTVGAIATDGYWEKRAGQRADRAARQPEEPVKLERTDESASQFRN